MLQSYSTKLVDSLRLFGRNYFVRFFVYLLLSGPAVLHLATLLGGLCLFMTSLLYLKAALSKEEWKPCLPNTPETRALNRPKQPSVAPPRAPHITTSDGVHADC